MLIVVAARLPILCVFFSVVLLCLWGWGSCGSGQGAMLMRGGGGSGSGVCGEVVLGGVGVPLKELF